MALPSVTTHLFLVTLALHVALHMTACMAQHATYTTATTPIKQSQNEKEIVFTYYLLPILKGPNATSAPVAGIQGEFWSESMFGSIIAADHILLEKPNIYSRQVGRVKGVAVGASKDGSYFYQTSSIIFTDDNSTLETQGVLPLSGQPRAVSITGGTGRFKGARGIDILRVNFQTAYYRISRIDFRFTNSI